MRAILDYNPQHFQMDDKFYIVSHMTNINHVGQDSRENLGQLLKAGLAEYASNVLGIHK